MVMLSFIILMFAGRYSKTREESSSPDRTLEERCSQAVLLAKRSSTDSMSFNWRPLTYDV